MAVTPRKRKTVSAADMVVDSFNTVKNRSSQIEGKLRLHMENALSKRTETLRDIDSLRTFYFAQLLVLVIKNDMFDRSGEGKYINISINEEHEHRDKIKDELGTMIETVDLHSIINIIIDDLLFYGTYALRINTSPRDGVVGLSDVYEPDELLNITDLNGKPLFSFRSKKYDTTGGARYMLPEDSRSMTYLKRDEVLMFRTNLFKTKYKIDRKELSFIVHFLKLNSDRIKGTKSSKQAIIDLIESFSIRTSGSVLTPAISKLMELRALEKTGIYAEIGSLLQPKILGVNATNFHSPTELMEITDRYDDLLNRNVAAVETLRDFDPSISDVAHVQTIPITSDKGRTEQLDTGDGSRIESTKQVKEDLKNDILDSLSISPEMMTGNEGGSGKRNVLYAKMIKELTTSVSYTIERLCLTHLRKKASIDYNVKFSDIEVTIANSTNIDMVDQTEAQDLLLTSMNQVMDLMETMSKLTEDSQYVLDKNTLIKSVIDQLSSISSPYVNAFKKREEVKNDDTIDELAPNTIISTGEEDPSAPSGGNNQG